MNLVSTIKSGLEYLAKTQEKDGGYASLSSATPDFSYAQTYRTTFLPSLILSTLTTVDNSLSTAIKSKLARHLMTQRREDWSYNYWTKDSAETTTMPYPNDLDDTFCAVSALYAHNKQLVDGTALAKLTRLLTQNEVQEGGPYKTWLIGPSTDKIWQDVDTVVNINIGYFLSLHGVELPNIVRCLEQAMPELISPYYASSAVPSYFAGRWYKGKFVADLLINLSGDSILEEAMYVSTAIRTGQINNPALKIRVARIVNRQAVDGSWPPQVFCVDPAIKGNKHYAGAASLTTALCLEALSLYVLHSQQKIGHKKPQNSTLLGISQVIRSLPLPEIRKQTKKVMRQILSGGNEEQILSLPWLIQRASNSAVDQMTLQQLASISLWGWMAYTVYDDFLDQEGDPLKLSSAHVCLRNLVATIAKTLPDNESFQRETNQILDRLDAANTWEIAHCRAKVHGSVLQIRDLPDYGDYWQLADRSLGHTIAGLGVLYASGEMANSKNMRALRDFFRHFLIARQLNDDAHDWLEDLQYGHINAVAVQILTRWLREQTMPLRRIDLEQETENLQKIMWNNVIQVVCKDIFKHSGLARKALAHTDFDKALLERLLIPLESAATEALHKRDETRAFIAAI